MQPRYTVSVVRGVYVAGMNDLDRCNVCYAYVESLPRHRQWHTKIDNAIDNTETLALDADDRLSELEG